jgi:hypothetical protein
MEPKSNVACPSAGLWANKSRVTQLRANGPFLGRLRPLNRWPALTHCTVSQVQIDKVLIRHAQIGGHLLEVVYRCGIQSNGDLALELLCVRIFSRLRKIVITSYWILLHSLGWQKEMEHRIAMEECIIGDRILTLGPCNIRAKPNTGKNACATRWHGHSCLCCS